MQTSRGGAQTTLLQCDHYNNTTVKCELFATLQQRRVLLSKTLPAKGVARTRHVEAAHKGSKTMGPPPQYNQSIHQTGNQSIRQSTHQFINSTSHPCYRSLRLQEASKKAQAQGLPTL
jgi:hypothetical protein